MVFLEFAPKNWGREKMSSPQLPPKNFLRKSPGKAGGRPNFPGSILGGFPGD